MGKFYFSNDMIEYLKTNKNKENLGEYRVSFWSKENVLKLDSGKA